ncbi:GDP-L-fucose synthase family protein [Litoreibacter janthinus]|uniref:GDP-L-fucose synthase n=1 Tax=Litoreibacter janthinus TaxID=670154 RepID=A0A1I6FQY8_9RHOB|nr:GDP-L-fucose synthase [Litoreibacter janthinus]SFR32294.1 GDP-L-fucose synthase [Litoreibacter janthinus]
MAQLKAKRILLTGGGGMVGQNLLEAAPHLNIDHPSSKTLDLAKANDVQAYLQDTKPDLIIHAAGKVGGIQANMADPVGFLDKNLAIGRNLIMGAYEARVPEFLNLASTCIYPRAADNPLREDMVLTGELEPTNEGYAIAKIAALRLCEYIRRQRPEMQYKTLIPCNLYGPHDNFHPEKSHLLPAIIRKVHDAKQSGAGKVEIWGDGTARREFMYAGDLASAILAAAAQMSSLPDLMNTGLGHDHSINDYYQTVADVLGWHGTFTHDLSKPVGMKQKLCSTEKATAWGWTASTSLTDGITKTYDYFLENHAS